MASGNDAKRGEPTGIRERGPTVDHSQALAQAALDNRVVRVKQVVIEDAAHWRALLRGRGQGGGLHGAHADRPSVIGYGT
jgi:hypothetical protein